MDLSEDQFYASLVGTPSMERPELMRVQPGEPENSYLIMKIRGGPGIVGVQMPLIGDKLSEEEIGTLEDWIRSLDTVDEARKAAAPEQPPLPFAGWQIVNAPTTRRRGGPAIRNASSIAPLKSWNESMPWLTDCIRRST